MAVSVDWQHLRMTLVQPQRGRGSGRGQVHGDARRAELQVQFSRIASMAAPLMALPLDDRLEIAGVYKA